MSKWNKLHPEKPSPFHVHWNTELERQLEALVETCRGWSEVSESLNKHIAAGKESVI